jgi:transposase
VAVVTRLALLPQNVSLSELPLIADGETSMRNGKRGRYTLEFKQEAVRLVESGQSVAEAARSLGVIEQTLANWVKAKRSRKLKEVSDKTGVTAEQVEISRLRAELARVTMERDILEKATAYFARGQK